MARSPLYDIYDPTGILQQQAEMGLLPQDDMEITGAFPLGQRKATLADLMPQEEKRGLLRSLAELGTSGLAAASYILDTPGALVRGVLAGKPLSVLGTSDERVDGRELLRQYGLIGDKDTWGNFAGGLAGEIVLDPLTYINPLAILGRGAYTRAGKAMEASGFFRNAAETAYEGLDPTLQQAARGAVRRDAGTGVRQYTRNLTPRQAIAESADPIAARDRWIQQAERLGVDPNDLDARAATLMSVGIPGTNLSFGTDIFGERFGDWAAQGLDRLGEASKRNPLTAPFVNTLYAGFHAPSGGTLNPDVQWDARIGRARADRANEAQELLRTRQLRAAMGVDAGDVADQIRAAGGQAPVIPEELRRFNSTDIQRALVDYAESSGVPTAPGVFGPTLKTSGDATADWVLENIPEFREMRDTYVSSTRDARLRAEAAGLSDGAWQSEAGTEFFPRQLKWWQRIMNPDRPNAVGRVEKPYSAGQRVLNTTDNFGRGRKDYTDIPGGQRTFRMLTGSIDPNLDSAALQQQLIGANARDARIILDRAFDTLGITRPFREEISGVIASPAFQQTGDFELLRPAYERLRRRQDDLVDLLRGSDLQFAQNRTGIFDTPGWTNLRRYERGQNRVLANANRAVERLQATAQPIGPGGLRDGMVQLTDAARRIGGFDDNNFRQMWRLRFGADPTNFAVPENIVEALRTVSQPTRLGDADRGFVSAIDQFTNAFKVGALASPAFHVRNTYSGNINAATMGAFNPLDYWAALRASMGNYSALGKRLRSAPGYETLPTDAARVARFLEQTGANRIGGGVFADDITQLPEQEISGTWLGAGNTPSVSSAFYQPGRSWSDYLNNFFSMRGVGITQNAPTRNTNPLLVANDAIGSVSEDAMRGGVFLNQIRKGVDPGRAADVVRMSQVDYSPQAFTAFERDFMKRVMPFYSFQKGILPSIANNLLYRPGGLMGQSIRSVARGSQPSEENFIPEHLRQSAAIPLPADLPWIFGGSGNDNLRRYLTNIDLPWESTLQTLLTPGVGATASATAADFIRKLGSNVLGQSNPLIKAPIEYVTNRQLYSGRDLSDLYSVLERDLGEIGRPLEQLAVNFVPFGSRALGTYRQLTDDRLSPADRYMKAAWNLLAGAKLTDIDQERSKQLAARQMLNDILQTTPGVRTYENITVPPEALASMPEQQRRLYLLYKIIQSQAAKRKRQQDKAQQLAIDPLQLLGVVG